MSRRTAMLWSVLSLVVTTSPAAAQQPARRPTPSARRPQRITVERETAGREPRQFVPIVGSWVVAREGGRNVLFIDGRAWKRGQPAGGLADKARAIYGARNEEFIESVKAFAYYPIAVARGVEDFRDGEISVRFQMVGARWTAAPASSST